MKSLNRMSASDSHHRDNDVGSDITGEWHGHYAQHSDKRPIKASITQEGDRLFGTMVDVHTETERSLFAAAAEAGLPPGADEKMDEQIRQLLPDAGNEPIRGKAILPDHSLLEGTVSGSFVRFKKAYQGQHFVGFEVGEQRVGWMIEEHCVHYSGRLSDDGMAITGNWTILEPETGRANAQGSFVLQRV